MFRGQRLVPSEAGGGLVVFAHIAVRYELRPKAQGLLAQTPGLQPGRCTQRLGFVGALP